MKVDDVFDTTFRERLAKPAGEGGTCLPNTCYTSREWLEIENERLFARTWVFAGCLDQIPDPGDILPLTIAGKPIMLVHGRDGVIRAFHNVCRHRGALIVDEPCRGKTVLTCPYHAWAYGLDGRLKSRPHFHGADSHDRPGNGGGPGLVPIRIARWYRFFFVNLDGQAQEFDDFIAPLARRLPHHDFNALRLGKTLVWEFRANWKIVFENYFDNYHVGTIHPRLDAFLPMSQRRPFEPDGPLLQFEALFDEPEAGRGVGLPYYPGVPQELAHFEAGYHLFPSVCFQIWPDQLTVFQVFPIAHNHTIEHLHIFFVGEGASEPAYEAARQSVYDMWDELNQEDINAIEWMQSGRMSPAFDGGRLSGYWDPSLQHFARLTVDLMS